MGRRIQASVGLVTFCWCAVGLAWGPHGHRVVGQVAELYLCAEARQFVRAELEGEDLASAGLWADVIRGDPDWGHTAPWHYMNVPDSVAVERRQSDSRGDVLWAVQEFSGRLAASDDGRSRREPLRFLVHFLADLHQPLHVGRASDRGGNDLLVSVSGRKMNLHKAWDSGILELDQAGYQRRARSIEPMAAGRVDLWQASTPLDWARESKALRPVVYDFRDTGPGVALSEAYLARARAVSELRLLQAGVRLAGVLNDLYCPSAAP